MSHVLVFCPTYRLEPETVRAIFEQDAQIAQDVWFARDNPCGHADGEADRANILYNVLKARTLVLEHPGYEALWLVESDILPPRDALRKLLACEGDTASGLYAMRHSDPHSNCLRAQGDSLSVIEWAELRPRWGETIPTDGTCHGCLLIRRHVLEQVSFRLHEDNPPDWGWMLDVKAAGFSQVCDTSIICGHKRPDGTVLWPGRERVEYERLSPSWWELV